MRSGSGGSSTCAAAQASTRRRILADAGTNEQACAARRPTHPTSAMMRGCRPSVMYRSACFISSPIRITMVVVPSLHGRREAGRHMRDRSRGRLAGWPAHRAQRTRACESWCLPSSRVPITQSKGMRNPSLAPTRPHPVTSSCATAVRAIMTAVGFVICISRSSVLPSLVSLMSAGQSRPERQRRQAFRMHAR